MSEYNPDVWVLLKISGTDVPTPYYRILAGWYGGYAGSDSWQMSSGVNEIIDRDTYWEMPNHSGSLYFCNKRCETVSSLTASIFARYQAQNTEAVTIQRVQCTAELLP